jgi:hypothetical protein
MTFTEIFADHIDKIAFFKGFYLFLAFKCILYIYITNCILISQLDFVWFRQPEFI